MDIKLLDIMDELIKTLDNSPLIKEINILKKEIYEDKELSALLDKFKKLSEYDNEYIEIKTKIIENEKIKRFRKLEHELNYLIRNINKKLNSLTNKGSCIV